MEENNNKEELNEEIEDKEELQFGYGASAIFLVFMIFIIGFSVFR